MFVFLSSAQITVSTLWWFFSKIYKKFTKNQIGYIAILFSGQ